MVCMERAGGSKVRTYILMFTQTVLLLTSSHTAWWRSRKKRRRGRSAAGSRQLLEYESIVRPASTNNN